MPRIIKISLFVLVLNIASPDLVKAQRPSSLVINEFMASNRSYNTDPQGQYDDWIELYNYGANAVNLGGMYLTDDLASPTKWRIPDATAIPAGGYLLIWADNDISDTGLHANFKLSGDGEEIGLFASDGNTLIDSVTFGAQTVDISYGRYPDAAYYLRFFSVPTPAAANDNAYLGKIEDLRFSHVRGFYDTPFSVTIATETEDVIIYYSLDGSEPYDLTGRSPSGVVYTTPVPIERTTCLRAMAIKDGWLPTKIFTHTYIFIDDVIVQDQQQALREGYTDTWSNFPADYEMDPEIYNDPDYADFMDDALLSIPTMSIVTDKGNLFGSSAGIYTHPLNEGFEWERPTSVELFDPNGSKEFQVNCGLRIQGGHSRHPHKCPKHSFSLRFRGIYGPTTLDYNLFGEDWPVSSFNLLHLRGFFNNAWTHWGSDQRERAQYIRDQWMRDSLTEMGNQDALQGFPVHLYLNGLYWGVYSLHERPDASHYAAYNGGDEDDIDAINGDPTYVISDPLNTGSVTDGTIDAWLELKDVVADRNWERICQLLDVDSFIDWTILFYFSGTTDIKQGTNWRAAGGGSQRKPWRFYSWDAEHVMENVNQFGIGTVSDPSGLFGYLENISEFRTRFGDRLHKHLFNNGALTTERNLERWINRSDEIRLAVIAESARWGDYRRDVHQYQYSPYLLYTRNDFWIPENNYITNDYFPRRTEIALNMFRSLDIYPRTDAPVFHINGSYQHGGNIESDDTLSMTASGGTIYYTLDGSDPHLLMPSQGDTAGTVIMAEDAAKRVLVPTGPVSDNWRGGQPFDDSTWVDSRGEPGGIGYERSSGYERYISLYLEDRMYGTNTTCYVRIHFTCDGDLNNIDSMALRVRYDDGFIAYLNGTEVARENFAGTPSWNSSAISNHSDSEAINFERIDISAFIDNLQQGSNLLAIHGMNSSVTSSDFLISAELVVEESSSPNDEEEEVPDSIIEYVGPVILPHSTQVKARVLIGNTWSALNEGVYAIGSVADNLRITEIMYNPYGPDDAEEPNEEYIELKNIGTETINLNLVKLTNGVDFIFPSLELASGEYVVVVQDIAAFEARYGRNINVAGQYSGRLNNAGERIELEDAIGQTILDFSYRDGWRSVTDGEGFSLTIIDSTATNDWNDGDSWRASAYISGSPGEDDSGIIPNPSAVVINELLARSPGNNPDWIELHNTTDTAIDISGWYLSDSSDSSGSGPNLTKYEIPAGTTIPPNGYIVFYQDQHFGNPNLANAFVLSADGERVYLSSAENGVLTGYRQVEDFGASAASVSFGRCYKPSTGNYNFVAMSENTPGSANSVPKVGPIVINEIMYNPSWPEGGSYTNEQYEYIELYNISSGPVNLEGWRFTDGIDFTFPVGVSIPAGGYLLVVKHPEAFMWRYPTVPSDIIYGPYNGNLSNAGERLELSKDSDSDVRIDRVSFSDGSHPEDFPGGVDLWPVEADGSGQSLTRRVPSDYGNDPDNWIASAPSPGQ
ncbi:MAG: lamin tail domain-containing protein [Phycisphaerales bacterium]|jgi:hypothetical protein